MPYVKVNGYNIYYEIHGDGEPVILLNGILANTTSWSLQVPALINNGFKVILMDFIGQGKSDKPMIKYNMEMHADFVKGLLDHLGIDKVNVVGISYGGEVGLIFTLKYQEMVKSLTTICSISKVNRVIKAMADRWLLAARFKSGRFLFQIMYPDIYSDEFIENKWEFIQSTAPNFDLVDFDAFIELLKSFMELDITDKLHKIKVPTLVIAAAGDKIKPIKYVKIIHEKIEGSVFKVIEDAGHLVIWEKPELVNNVLINFLKSRN